MIFQRIRHLLAADLHDVLDRAEDRVLSLKQDLRELEAALDAKRARHAEMAEAGERLRRARARLEPELAAVEADLELALDGGNDELARFCVKKLHPIRTEARVAALEAGEYEAALAELTNVIARQTTDCRALAARVEAAVARRQALSLVTPGAGCPATVAPAEEEIDLELMRRRRERVAADAAAAAPGGRP